jgi:hypothetical protein
MSLKKFAPKKERGLGMSAPMILSYLAGIKGETRRLFKKQPVWLESGESRRRLKPGTLFLCPDMMPTSKETTLVLGIQENVGLRRFMGMRDFVQAFSPYGQPGDELWFREPWKVNGAYDYLAPSKLTVHSGPIAYLADGDKEALGRYRHSRFMCRWMSRVRHVPILDIRVERVQDITEKGAINEGVEPMEIFGHGMGWKDYGCEGGGLALARDSYRTLWELINGPGSWEKNEWVWVIKFPLYKKP